MSIYLLTCAHLLVSLLPVIAALWGMALVANGYEWAHYRAVVAGASFGEHMTTWVVVKQGGEDSIRNIRCQEIVIRRYQSR